MNHKTPIGFLASTEEDETIEMCPEKPKCKEPKKKLKALDKYVIFSILAMIVYTIVSQLMCVFCSTDYNLMVMDTLTTCFFGFFGGEIVTCALIKIFKLKTKNDEDGGAVG